MNTYTIIVIIYFAGLIIIGWLGNRASSKSHASGKTTWQEEFFTGAKKISPIVLGFTFAATFASGRNVHGPSGSWLHERILHGLGHMLPPFGAVSISRSSC